MTHLDAGEQLVQEIGDQVTLQRPQLKRPSSQRREQHAVGAGDNQLGGVVEGMQHQFPALLELFLVVYKSHDDSEGPDDGLADALSLVF